MGLSITFALREWFLFIHRFRYFVCFFFLSFVKECANVLLIILTFKFTRLAIIIIGIKQKTLSMRIQNNAIFSSRKNKLLNGCDVIDYEKKTCKLNFFLSDTSPWVMPTTLQSSFILMDFSPFCCNKNRRKKIRNIFIWNMKPWF